MTIESKIIYRSDASEVKRDIATLRAARGELEKLRAGTGADPKIALQGAKDAGAIHKINAKGLAQFQIQQQKNVGKVVLEQVKQNGAKGLAIEKSVAAAKAKIEANGAKETTKRVARARASRPRIEQSEAAGGGGRGLSITDMKSALDMALQVGKVIYSAGAAVVQAQAFKEDVTRGFAIIARSKAEGDRVLAMSSATADFLGRGRAETAGQFLDLLTKGFKPEKVDEITRRLADLSVVDPRANLEGLSRAIGQIAGKGRLQGQELLQLAEAGLETGDVYKALAKNLGKSVPEIIKLQEAGKLSADIATQGILDAIAGQTGGKAAGEAARAKAREDLSGLIRQISAIPENLLFDIKVGPGMDKLKEGMRQVIDFFDVTSDTGKDVRAVLGDTINAFAEGLFGVDTSKGITETLKGLLETLRASKGDIKGFAAGIASIGSTLAGITGFFGKISQMRMEFERLSGINISGPLGIFKGLLLGIPSIIAQTISSAIQSITGFSLWDAGVNLVNSLAGGIKSTAQSVIDAVTSTVGGAISWAKKLLGIASPSKVFMQIGDFSGKGLAMGLSANDNAVKSAAGGMAGASVGGAAGMGLGSRSSRVSSTTIAATFNPVYHVTALGPKEVDELRALQADERAKFDMMIASYMTREANAA